MRLGHEQQLQKRTVSTGSCGLKIRQQLVFSTESLKTEKKKKKTTAAERYYKIRTA